jgi:hypothetical protein
VPTGGSVSPRAGIAGCGESCPKASEQHRAPR